MLRGETTEWASRRVEKDDGSLDAKSGVTEAKFGTARVDAATGIPKIFARRAAGVSPAVVLVRRLGVTPTRIRERDPRHRASAKDRCEPVENSGARAAESIPAADP